MKHKTVIISLITVLLCAVSYFLPGAVLAVRDRALVSSSQVEYVDEVQLSLLSDLSTPQKLAVAGDPAATSIRLSSGRNLTEEEARETADGIAVELCLLDKEPEDFTVTLTPELRVASDDSALLTWTAAYSSDTMDAAIVFDDELGQCLGFSQTSYPFGRDVSYSEEAVSVPSTDYQGALYDVGGSKYPKSTSEYYTDEFFYNINLLLSPLGLTWDNVSVNSPYSVSVIIPYDNTYYSMPVTVRMRETDDGLDYSMMISVNM